MDKPEMIQLSASDWAEVYYAVETKLHSPVVGEDSEWREQLRGILAQIAEHVTV